MNAMQEMEASCFRLSRQQQWIVSAQERTGRTLYACGSVSFGAEVELQRLLAAIDAVVSRHEILRTIYPTQSGGHPRTQMPSERPMHEFSDARHIIEDEASARQAACAALSLDGPALSFRLIREAATDRLVFALPRLALDRPGAAQLANELRAAYEHRGLERNTEIQYVDYAEWQHGLLASKLSTQADRFWQGEHSAIADVRVRWERRAAQESPQRWDVDICDAEIQAAFAKLTAQCALNDADVALGLWAAFLTRVEERTQVVVAVECDARGEAVDAVLGPFTITMPVVLEIDPAATLRQILRDVSLKLAQSRSWIQHCDGVERCAFAFEHVSALEEGVTLDVDQPAMFKLGLSYCGDGQFRLSGAQPLFSEQSLVLRAAQLRSFVLNACSAPEERLESLDFRGRDERRYLLDILNSSTAVGDEPCIHRLIEARAAEHPDANALLFDGRAWTFRQLNSRANQLARQLRDWGAGPETLVAICAERSAELVVALLAVLKSGAAYLPIDPSYPSDRIGYMLDDASPRVLVTQQKFLSTLPPAAAHVWCLDRDGERIDARPRENLTEPVHPRSLAYCIYTSGSTGRPKACQIEHAALSRYLLWASRFYFDDDGQNGLDQGSFGLYSSLSFDLTVTSLFLPLLRGRPLRVFAEDVPVDAVLERSFAPDSDLDAIKLTPAHLSLLRALRLPPSKVALAIVGGEALLPEQVRTLHDLNADMKVCNEYGPTEATVGCVAQWIERGEQDIAIGRPNEGCRVYVLDPDGGLAPLGSTGELHISGLNLARGYGGRPAVTAERFIADPYSDVPGARMYRTGDLVRYRSDGVLEYVGRADHQVKVRGHRIELGEIEGAIAGLADVRATAVVVHESSAGERRLIAYVVSEQGIPSSADEAARRREQLRAALARSLPEYMVPAQFVFLARLPLNANGKVDRKALPPPEIASAPSVPPRTPVEAQLAAIWKEVLRREGTGSELGVHDHFFEVGGDSIIAIQVVSRARDAGWSFTPKELFQNPTIAELARVARATTQAPRPEAAAAGEVPLTPIQQWFLQLPVERRDHWNQSVLLQLSRPMHAARLEQALQYLAQHHDALRLRFEQHADGCWRQWYAETVHGELSTTLQIGNAAEIERHSDQLQRSLDLARGPLLRVLQLVLPDGSARLLLVVHHLVVDGVSWRILLNDLRQIHAALERESAVALPAKTASFQAWSLALHRHAQSDAVRGELPYWRAVVGKRSDSRAPVSSSGDRQSASVELDETRTRQLLTDAHRAYRTQINDLLLTALARTLHRCTGRDSLLVELEGHGREDLFDDLDVTRTVGWFTTQYPIRLACAGLDLAQSISSVKQELRRIPCNGVGYGVLRFLAGQAELEYPAGEAQARFNHLGQLDGTFGAEDWRPAAESMGRAKSDSQDSQGMLDWTTLVYGGTLRVRCTGSPDEVDLVRLLQIYLQELCAIIDHCMDEANGALSPADVPLADITQEQLARLPVPVREIEDIYSLSPLQQGLLLHTLLNPGSGMYLMQDVFHTGHSLDEQAVQRAWDRVVARHAILRTSFLWREDAAPVQIVHRAVPSAVQFLDWSHMPRAAAEQRLRSLLQEELAAGFDVARPCLSRLRLVRTAGGEHLLAHSFHHLLMDAWCRSLLFEDFLACYAAERTGEDVSRPQPRRYRDFIAWLRRQDVAGAREYWRRELAGFRAITPVPLIEKVTTQARSEVRNLTDRLSIEDTRKLQRFVQEHRLTLNTLVQAAWALVLAAHADREDVLFGVTVAGRPTELAGIERTLGLFINTLPLRVQVPPRSRRVPVVAWLQSLLDKNVAMRQHEHLSLVEIQALSELPRGTPLFETLFVFENAPFAAEVAERAEGLGLRGLSGRTHTNYPLTVVAAPAERFLLELSCDVRYFDMASAQRILTHLKQVLLTLMANPRAAVADMDWLSGAERELHLELERPGAASYCLQASYVERFEAQVRARPEALAARCGPQQISYEALNARANGIAHRLLAAGIRHDDLIVIHAARGIELLAMILGTFKSGAAYLALEPGYPPQRFQQVVQLARPAAVLCTQSHREWLDAQLSAAALDSPPVLLTIDSQDDVYPTANPGICVDARQRAYVIYTSGSTGVPKGVTVEHAGMLNNQLSKIETWQLDAGDVIAQTASCSFDISVWQWLTALLCGARVEVMPDEVSRDPRQLLRAIRDTGVTVLESVPAMIQAMLAEAPLELPSLRYLVATGEALPASVARRWLERYPQIRLLNAYGPAECSDDVSMHEQSQPPGTAANVSIGRATPNNRLYVLGSDLQRLPAGAIGEICVAGAGVGRGYLHDPARTAVSFVAHPYGGEGERLYRTGDLGRYRSDGSLDYLGRIDQQVKLLGYRIEPGEIEARLIEHAEVAAAAVLVSQPSGQPARLVAYVVPAPGTGNMEALRERLRAHLLERLPRYMVPAQFVWLAALPMNANGKVDRQALQRPADCVPREFVEPRTRTERQLAELWQEVLRVERVGIDDDFFELGGHSLLATQVASRIRHRLGADIALARLFEATTIAALAREVDACLAGLGERQDLQTMTSLLDALEAQ